MTAKDALVNIKGYTGYDISNYPLSWNEAEIVVKALEFYELHNPSYAAKKGQKNED